MARTRKKYTREFKFKVISEIAAGKSVASAIREYGLYPSMINKWRSEHAKHGEKAFPGNGNPGREEARIAALERKIGQLVLENDLLKKVLAACQEPPPLKSARGSKR